MKTVALIVIFVSLTCYVSPSFSKPRFTAVDIPSVKGAYRLESGKEKDYQTYFLSYYFEIQHPASDVTSFYAKYFQKNGWQEVDRQKTFGWVNYPTRSATKSWWTTGYSRTWDHPHLGISATMVLTYTHPTEKPEGDLHVFFRTYKTKAMKALLSFLDRLQKEKKDMEFFQLLNKYKKDPEGEPDLEQAVRENPDNKLLKEYKAIGDMFLKP